MKNRVRNNRVENQKSYNSWQLLLHTPCIYTTSENNKHFKTTRVFFSMDVLYADNKLS